MLVVSGQVDRTHTRRRAEGTASRPLAPRCPAGNHRFAAVQHGKWIQMLSIEKGGEVKGFLRSTVVRVIMICAVAAMIGSDCSRAASLSCSALGNNSDTANACGYPVFHCEDPVVSSPSYQLGDPSCDPASGSCGFTATMTVEFKQNRSNYCDPNYPATIILGSFVCNAVFCNAGAHSGIDLGLATVSGTFSCTSGPSRVDVHECPSTCDHLVTVDVDPAAHFCKHPPKSSCGGGSGSAEPTCAASVQAAPTARRGVAQESVSRGHRRASSTGRSARIRASLARRCTCRRSAKAGPTSLPTGSSRTPTSTTSGDSTARAARSKSSPTPTTTAPTRR